MMEKIQKNEEKYRLTFDWHTHTVYSHGKGSIEDNVKAAIEKNLTSVAITDHGPGHVGYGFRRREIPKMRAEIEALREKYPQIRIYMSVEANIINASGDLDVRPEEFRYYDFVIAGYHFGTLGKNPAGSLVLHGRNLASSKRKRYSAALMRKNTDLVIRALKKDVIKTLTHPGDKGAVFLEEVAAACAETGTLMEISNRHRQLTVEEIRTVSGYGVNFIIGSDAHVPQRVGTCEKAVERAVLAGLDLSRIVNLEMSE